MLSSVSLRALINVRIALAVLIVLCLGIVTAVWQARESVGREVLASFNLAVEMIESSLQNDEMQSHWQHILTALQHARHINVTLIDQQGIERNLLNEDHTKASEKAPRLYRYLVAAPIITAEYQIHFAGEIQTIRVTSDPNDEISEAWDESLAFFLSIMVMMLLIYIMINLVFHSAFKAVSKILHGLREVESGEYSHALPVFNISEFDAIGEEINLLSRVLAEARENNQALARHTLHIQESERQTLSRELHDEMGQSLTAIKAMSVASKQPSSDINTIADSIISICNHLSGVVRSMMRTLHPLSLKELGLGATVKDMISEWQRRYPQLTIALAYDEAMEHVSDELAIHLYRIIQEGLTNVVKHSDADKVHIELKKTYIQNRDFAYVSVIDNGHGGSNEGDGFGIRSMRERVESMHGSFQFQSVKGEGVMVSATIPYLNKNE